MSENRVLIPPDPMDESLIAQAPGESSLHFLMSRQRERAIAMGVAGLTAFLARWAGVVEFSALTGLLMLALGFLTIAGFIVLYRRKVRQGRQVSLSPWWLMLDVVFVSGLVWLTGGLSSPWAVLYLACAGRAALMRGLRPALVTAGAGAVAYLGVVVALGQSRGLDAGLARGLVQIAVLYGSTALLLVGVSKLRQSQATIKRLHAESRRQVAELRSVTADLEATSALLRDMTLTDPLTGARNRRYLRDMANTATERRARWGKSDRRTGRNPHGTGVLIVDLDHFKEINDRYGHPAGDRALKHAARILRRCLRSEDTLVRWGGDEFLILVAGGDSALTVDVAERIVTAFAATPCEVEEGVVVGLRCSVGWSHLDWHEGAVEPLEAAVAAADRSLLEAKQTGRGRFGARHRDAETGAEEQKAQAPAPRVRVAARIA